MTAPYILRARRTEAVERASAHAESIAGENEKVAEKIEELRAVRGRDALHEETYRLEALADLLEAVDEATAGDAAKPQRTGGVNATPAAMEKADELGVDISSVQGTGKNGKVTTGDVEACASEAPEASEE
jgi:pyruvate/2-oxoglutarate dehydrogenase complex dihydrolipoamide acyltransferase (E2) component